jgi:hypothetical protein
MGFLRRRRMEMLELLYAAVVIQRCASSYAGLICSDYDDIRM